jgi:hypothetical protein
VKSPWFSRCGRTAVQLCAPALRKKIYLIWVIAAINVLIWYSCLFINLWLLLCCYAACYQFNLIQYFNNYWQKNKLWFENKAMFHFMEAWRKKKRRKNRFFLIKCNIYISSRKLNFFIVFSNVYRVYKRGFNFTVLFNYKFSNVFQINKIHKQYNSFLFTYKNSLAISKVDFLFFTFSYLVSIKNLFLLDL